LWAFTKINATLSANCVKTLKITFSIGLKFYNFVSVVTPITLMKRIQSTLTVALFILALVVQAQDLSKWPADSLQMANTAGHTATLSPEEKKLVQLVNLARMDGNAFMKRIAMPYIKANDKDDDEYVEGLYADLRKTKGLHLLKPLETLHKSAAHHATDMGTKGQLGHDSSDGTTFTMRIHKFHKPVTVSENINYGYSDAVSILMEMLIDEGVTDRTHRHNILGKTFNHIGVSIKPHKMMEFNCVMDFSVE
jgi:uncharacterized protein YkwD